MAYAWLKWVNCVKLPNDDLYLLVMVILPGTSRHQKIRGGQAIGAPPLDALLSPMHWLPP